MYAAQINSDRRTVRVYSAQGTMILTRSFSQPVVQVNISGNLVSVVDARGRMWVYELPTGTLKYSR